MPAARALADALEFANAGEMRAGRARLVHHLLFETEYLFKEAPVPGWPSVPGGKFDMASGCHLVHRLLTDAVPDWVSTEFRIQYDCTEGTACTCPYRHPFKGSGFVTISAPALDGVFPRGYLDKLKASRKLSFEDAVRARLYPVRQVIQSQEHFDNCKGTLSRTVTLAKELPPLLSIPLTKRDAAVGEEKPRVEWAVDQLPLILDLSEMGDGLSRTYRLHSVHMHGNYHYDSLIAFEGATAAESTTFVNVDCIKQPTTRVADTHSNGYPKVRDGRVCVNVWYRRVDRVNQ